MIPSLYPMLAVLVGFVIAVYLPMNSLLARYVGSSALANVPFYFIGLIATIGITLAFQRGNVAKLAEAPWWVYLAGVLSAGTVLGMTFLMPKLGPRAFFVLMVGGQVLMGMFLSHFGLLSMPKDPLTFMKALGAALVVAGAAITMLARS